MSSYCNKVLNIILLLLILNYIHSFSITQSQYSHITKNNIAFGRNDYNNKKNDVYGIRRFSLKDNDELGVEETVEKYGLEAGMFKAMTKKKNNGDDEGELSSSSSPSSNDLKPADLLKKYGSAYLITSVTLAIISYATCYALISNGVDVNELLEKIGIKTSASSTNVGTAAIAYAVHKAASPIRFPPTVALTPIVAGWIGSKNTSGNSNDGSDMD